MKPSETTAAILAGGLGTRLKSAVPDRPKALALIHGRPFLSYLLQQIEQAGISETVLCTGFGADQIEGVFGDHFGRMRLRYSREDIPLGTGGALRLASPLIHSEWLLIFNGDSFAQIDLAEFCFWHRQKSAQNSIALASMPDTSRFGRVEMNDQEEIVRFAEKMQHGGPGRINAGIYLLHRDTVSEIPAERAVSIEREIFPGLIGRRLFGFSQCGQFLDIGTPESYAAAEKFFQP